MPFDVGITGSTEYGEFVKLAIAGYPGAGKTLFASTAPNPFFIWFREQPRVMSVARRYVPHTKLTNKVDDSGRLVAGVPDLLMEVRDYLAEVQGNRKFSTVVIDTGDEMQLAMRESRRIKNRGTWSMQDWGWLLDSYREIMNAFIDLPMHLIVTFHLQQSQEGDDGVVYREFALQGKAKDEVPGWFDIVGALDTYERVTDKGEKETIRALLTDATPRYPWAKDHSGNLPRLFDISERFVGDFERLCGLVYSEENLPAAESQLLEHIELHPQKEESTGGEVVTPVALEEKKVADLMPKKTKTSKKKEPVIEPETRVKKEKEEEDEEKVEGEPQPVPIDEEPGSQEEESQEEESQEEESQEEELVPMCEVCEKPIITQLLDDDGNKVFEDGEPVMVADEDMVTLSKIRTRKVLCVEHLRAATKKGQ